MERHYTNQKFDEALDVTQSTGEYIETPETKSTPSFHANETAEGENKSLHDDEEEEVKGKPEALDEDVANDRFDAAFSVESGGDNSSVDTMEQYRSKDDDDAKHVKYVPSMSRQFNKMEQKQHDNKATTRSKHMGKRSFDMRSPKSQRRRLFDQSDDDDNGDDDNSANAADISETDSTEGNISSDTSSESSSTFHSNRDNNTPIKGQYDPNDYANLENISDDISELFQYINMYKPINVDIDTPLKCFIPSYIPAIGDVDPFLKIPRPDGKDDKLGLVVLDEPGEKESDAAVLELQLRALSKKKLKKGDVLVRSIEHAVNNPNNVTDWIESIEKLHVSQPPPEVHYKKSMPSVEELMVPWPEEVEVGIKKGDVKLPDTDLDLSLEEYARVLCSILGIPVHDGNIIDSLHLMMDLYLRFQETQS